MPATAKFEEVRSLAAGYRACGLWHEASQTVFGEGAVPAELMLVGEQPGEQEDRQGTPLLSVRPAG